jgi:predicted nucleotidyltransferase
MGPTPQVDDCFKTSSAMEFACEGSRPLGDSASCGGIGQNAEHVHAGRAEVMVQGSASSMPADPLRDTRSAERVAQVKAMLKEQLLRYEPELKGHRVFLFGSRASGTARPNSDFDVGVYGEEPLPLKTFFAIEDRFDDLPTLCKIDWVDLNRASPEFRERAMKKIEILYE